MWAPNWEKSAHEQLKRRYGKYILLSTLLAIAAAVLGAAFAPPYIPSPYKLRERKIQAVNAAAEVYVPPPPKEVAAPEIPTEFTESEDADEDATIAPTIFNADAPPVIPQAVSGPQDFTHWDEDPVPIRQVLPEYPEFAREAGMRGTVKVRVVIDENGRVIDASVFESDASAILEKAAVEAARKWLFKPAMQRDVPVKCMVVLTFPFELD